MIITRSDTGQSMTFDVIRADFAPEAVVTEHPVEFGAEVTDHVQTRPNAFTVEVFVSSSPRGFFPVPFAVEDAIRFLEGVVGQLCTVVIPGEGTFPSVVVEGVSHSRTAVAGRAFTIRVKQVRIALAVSVPIPARMPAPVAASGAPSAVHNGQVAALQSVTLQAAAATATAGAAAPVSALRAVFNALSPFH